MGGTARCHTTGFGLLDYGANVNWNHVTMLMSVRFLQTRYKGVHFQVGLGSTTSIQ